MKLYVTLATICVVFVTGCLPTFFAPFAGPESSFRLSPLAAGEYFGLAWTRPDELLSGAHVSPALSSSHSRSYTETRLFNIALDSEIAVQLPLQRDDRCWNWDVMVPFALPDGRLGYLERCRMQPASEVWKERSTFRALNLDTNELETLGEVFREDPDVPIAPLRLAWDPAGGRRGLVAAAGYLCSNLLWLSREGPELTDAKIESFGLSDMFRPGRRPVTGCADYPSWSPDGNAIALYADPVAVRNGEFQTIDENWSLYIAARDLGDPRAINGPWSGQPRGLAWTPDGQALVLATAEHLDDGPGGLWVHDLGTEDWTQLTDKSISWMALSPDGQRVAVLHEAYDNEDLLADLYSRDPELSDEAARKLLQVELLIFELERGGS